MDIITQTTFEQALHSSGKKVTIFKSRKDESSSIESQESQMKVIQDMSDLTLGRSRCPICFNYLELEILRKFPCGHALCRECFARMTQCPPLQV